MSFDERLALGSLLIEYLYPLIEDQYLMEDLFLQLLQEVTMIGKDYMMDLILDLVDIHLAPDQMKVFISKLMKATVRKISNLMIVNIKEGKP